jgi:hypothetical protein
MWRLIRGLVLGAMLMLSGRGIGQPIRWRPSRAPRWDWRLGGCASSPTQERGPVGEASSEQCRRMVAIHGSTSRI